VSVAKVTIGDEGKADNGRGRHAHRHMVRVLIGNCRISSANERDASVCLILLSLAEFLPEKVIPVIPFHERNEGSR
jgi:hypothetical protein